MNEWQSELKNAAFAGETSISADMFVEACVPEIDDEMPVREFLSWWPGWDPERVEDAMQRAALDDDTVMSELTFVERASLAAAIRVINAERRGIWDMETV